MNQAMDINSGEKGAILPWQEKSKEVIASVVAKHPELQIYAVEIGFTKSSVSFVIKLESLANKFGSPSIDDCEFVAKEVKSRLIELYEKESGPEDFNIEVSSAGAERELFGVDHFRRYRELPMKLQYFGDNQKLLTRIVKFIDVTEQGITWQTVSTKKQKLNKAQIEDFMVENEKIKKVSLYLDF